jgi:hypothetical protein
MISPLFDIGLSMLVGAETVLTFVLLGYVTNLNQKRRVD